MFRGCDLRCHEKRNSAVGKTKRGKGRSAWQWQTAPVFPSLSTQHLLAHEITLVEEIVEQRFIEVGLSHSIGIHWRKVLGSTESTSAFSQLSAGGGTAILARVVRTRLTEHLGQRSDCNARGRLCRHRQRACRARWLHVDGYGDTCDQPRCAQTSSIMAAREMAAHIHRGGAI